jgi:serine protease Do
MLRHLVLLATVTAAVACGRSGSRATPGAAPGPEAPASPPLLPATPAGPVTPKTEAPSEARVLSSAFSAVARAMRPTVVRIDVEIQTAQAGSGRAGRGDAPFFHRFFGLAPAEPEPQRGTGSGVVLDARGDIITNRHVVSGATTLNVTFSDGRVFTAKTLGMDSETDVAVIRLDKPPADLVAARLGDSDKLEVGEWVIAVGSPLGLDQTVTAGIVSGKGKVGRHVQMSGGRVRRYIQTDAKINPGNSGGPLVNLSSEVVGINTLINTGPGGAYGFAIPINQVRMVAAALIKEGRVRYPYLGVLVGELPPPQPGKPGPGADTGALVSQATPGGPAAKAGLRAGDVITDIDGQAMTGANDVIDYVSTKAIGARVSVGYVRDGKKEGVAVQLGELPGAGGATGAPEALGLSLQTLTPDLAASMGLDPATKGAVIAEVTPGSKAAAAGLEEGDVILEVDRQRVGGADDATSALAAPRKGGHLLRVRSPNGTRFITLGGG